MDVVDDARIEAALREASDTRSVLIGNGVLSSVGDVFGKCYDNLPAVVIADENTFAVAGGAVHQWLASSNRQVEQPIIFPGRPALYADYENVLALESKLRNVDAIPVVVGSGTLNDITKLAAHRVARPYMVVATAASMDGYTAFGAAITKDGFKQTMSCPAPMAVLADIDILVRAPREMNSTGYGDLLGKITAGADWLIADALEIEPIDPLAWSLVQDNLRTWTGKPDLVHAGDKQAIAHLFEGLIMSGVAMQISASSRPASGSEHRFSHLWEMQALGHGESAVPHGFKVAVGTIAAAALYERLLARDLTELDVDALCRAWPSRNETEKTVRGSHDIPQLAENAVEESLAKYVDAGQLRQRLILIRERWPQIREKLQAQLMSAEQLAALLEAAGCPTGPAGIGLDMARLTASYELARTIRRRYTVLDLVAETGVLSACVAEIFARHGYWGRAAGQSA
jgi:glycerol-1-phosphate dehydrogenase [NAD(P)+]